MNDDNKLLDIIDEFFGEDNEVKEVATYILSHIHISNLMITNTLYGDDEFIIPTRMHKMCSRFSNNMTTNSFWISNYAPVKMALVLHDVKTTTQIRYFKFLETSEGDVKRSALEHIRAILLSYSDALTVLAFLWKGSEFAEEFDTKFRVLTGLSKEQQKFFEDAFK